MTPVRFGGRRRINRNKGMREIEYMSKVSLPLQVLTDGPDITSFIITATDNLGRHRIWRPHRLVMDLAKGKVFAQTKVDHLQFAICIKITE
jgi:hypothetical protein